MTVVNSINPYRIEGQKTGAFEVVDALGEAPDFHCIPVGNAGNITAYWKGYREYQDAGRSSTASGDARVPGGRRGADRRRRTGRAPGDGRYRDPDRQPRLLVRRHCGGHESGGGISAVTDEQILEAYRYLATEESVFCEPASAASVAGLLDVGVPAGATVVCVLTGHGLKDPDVVIGQIAVPSVVDADYAAVRAELGL